MGVLQWLEDILTAPAMFLLAFVDVFICSALHSMREKWSTSLMKRREYLDEQIHSLIDKPGNFGLMSQMVGQCTQVLDSSPVQVAWVFWLTKIWYIKRIDERSN